MPVIEQASTLSAPLGRCLFGLVEGICSYVPQQAPILFSLGEAISAFGLIFAVYQLRKISWDLVLNIRPWYQKNSFWILGALGLFLVFMANLMPSLPFYFSPPTPIFGYPSFFEILAYFAFILSPVSLLYFGKRKSVLNKKNSERFYRAMHYGLERIDASVLEGVVDIIHKNLKTLFTQAEEGDAYASAVFAVILSDQRVAEYITVNRLDFIIDFFDLAEKFNPPRRDIKLGTDALYENLLYNQNSFLYSQLNLSGTSISANLYQYIFERLPLMNKLEPYSRFSWGKKMQSNSQSVKVFIETMEHISKAYFSRLEYAGDARALKEGFAVMKRRVQDWVYSIRSGDLPIKEGLWLIHEFADFLGRIFPHQYGQAQKSLLVNLENADREAYIQRNSDLMTCYAETVYEIIESVSILLDDEHEKDEDFIRTFILHTIMENDAEGNHEMARRKLSEQIWKKIDENKKGYFPVVLRAMLLNMPWWMSVSGEDEVQKNKLKEALVDLKPKMKEKMANRRTTYEEGLLPTAIRYDEGSHKYYYVSSFSGEETEIV